MKRFPLPLPFTLILTLALLSLASAFAQADAGLDENTRLMQEYMARRAEWVEVRRAALDKIKTAKNNAEKKQLKDKLAEDEKPYLARMGEAGRAYHEAEKAKRPAPQPSPTSTK